MTPNEKIAREFADQFDPPLTICRTERINNMLVRDAWQISYWNAARGIGITAVAYGDGLHAFLEAAGPGEIAADAGQALATALGLLHGQKENTDSGTDATAAPDAGACSGNSAAIGTGEAREAASDPLAGAERSD